MHQYDRGFTPPAPVVDVVVMHPLRQAERAGVRGKLDTGADLTVIPSRLVVQLGILPHGQVWARGYDGVHTRRHVYYVRMILEETVLASVRCIAADRAYVLLGRNVLNRFVATLDGKKLTFDLRDP
jgi:predicted aspartyl protease